MQQISTEVDTVVKPFGVDATSTLPTYLAKMVEVICG